MDASMLDDAFAHHTWATTRVLDACAKLTPEQLGTSVSGTYGSILDTLRHLVGSDSWYRFRLSRETTAQIDEDHMSVAELRAAFDDAGEVWSKLLEDATDPDALVEGYDDDGSVVSWAHEHPDRTGPAPPNRSSEPDLHGPHDARDRAARHRRLGLRRRTRSDGRDPARRVTRGRAVSSVDGCLACDLAEGRLELPGGLIDETDRWRVEHTVGPLNVGTLIVKPKRHVLHVAQLTDDEARELGPLLRRTAEVVTELLEPEQVYVTLWSHAGAVPGHIHWVVQPIAKAVMDAFDDHGPFLQVRMFEEDQAPEPGAVRDFADLARALLRSEGDPG